MLQQGKSVALVTNAGTPAISDPGFILVRAALQENILLSAIPGPTALITALILSGLPVHSFTFRGFPPHKAGPRRRFLEIDKESPHTLVFYESPYRMSSFLKDALEVYGDRQAAIANDLTKYYESVTRGLLSELAEGISGENAQRRILRGDCRKMTPPRFYLPPGSIQAPVVHFPADRYPQMANVLRLKAGDVVHVFDISGAEYQVRIEVIQRKEIRGVIEEIIHPQTEPAIALELWVCATRREKIEWIIQKCTEIGVARFRMLVSERSLVQNLDDVQQKTVRWQQIAMEAAEQSGRTQVPLILPALTFQSAVAGQYDQSILKCIAWELDREHTIEQVINKHKSPQSVILLIGPEGGLSDAEVKLALEYGFHAITLGQRIFRLETAAIVGSVLMLKAYNAL